MPGRGPKLPLDVRSERAIDGIKNPLQRGIVENNLMLRSAVTMQAQHGWVGHSAGNAGETGEYIVMRNQAGETLIIVNAYRRDELRTIWLKGTINDPEAIAAKLVMVVNAEQNLPARFRDQPYVVPKPFARTEAQAIQFLDDQLLALARQSNHLDGDPRPPNPDPNLWVRAQQGKSLMERPFAVDMTQQHDTVFYRLSFEFKSGKHFYVMLSEQPTFDMADILTDMISERLLTKPKEPIPGERHPSDIRSIFPNTPDRYPTPMELINALQAGQKFSQNLPHSNSDFAQHGLPISAKPSARTRA